MLDHVFVSVGDVGRSIAFYEQVLAPLGISHVLDYDGKDGPLGHPDLKGFGQGGRVLFWLRPGPADSRWAHIGFLARSRAEGRRVPRRRPGGWRQGQWRAGPAAALRSSLLRRQRLRP
jgi:catechol 2,3-dioxygenase-like lactoylglutathione lyase family enzyme